MSYEKSIDVVYTWCGSPETEYCKYNRDLAFSIKSVKKFMPWVRKIWISVPDEANLKRLPKKSNKIQIIKESEFVPKLFLPCWNSNVIESWLWRIKGISEHFIYFCDDMYVGKPLKPIDFFIHGKPIMRIYEGQPDYPALSKLQQQIYNGYVRMWAGAVEKYNLHYTRIQHQALPYKKSLMKRFFEQYKKEVLHASKNKARKGEHDFNLLRFTSPLSVMHGESFLIVTNDSYDFFTEYDDIKRIEMIPKIKPAFFCINNSDLDWGEKIYYPILKKYFA